MRGRIIVAILILGTPLTLRHSRHSECGVKNPVNMRDITGSFGVPQDDTNVISHTPPPLSRGLRAP
jgi:hypothetical protein